MDALDLIAVSISEYYAIQAADPDWEKEQWAFLIARGFSPDEIWTYSPAIGYAAEQIEPEWI